MGQFRLDRLLDVIVSTDLVVILLWLGLAGLTVALLVLMRTRWGQSRPLQKCLVLSVLAHVLLAGYATTVHIVSSSPLQAKEPAMQVTIAEEEIGEKTHAPNASQAEKPWESFVHPSVVQPVPDELARAETTEIAEPQRQPRTEPTSLPHSPSPERLTPTEPVEPQVEALSTDAPRAQADVRTTAPEPIRSPAAKRRDGARARLPDRPSPKRQSPADTSPSRAQRSDRTGLPSQLLKQPLPVPRLSNVETTPDPQQALSGAVDVLSRGSQGSPVEWADVPPPRPSPRADAASIPSAGPAPAETGRLKAPSLAMRNASNRLPAGDAESTPDSLPALGPPPVLPNRRGGTLDQVPAIYRLRVAPDRSAQAQQRGGTRESEEAVKAALAWMADNQAPDGHWDAKAHGAGQELHVAGRDRQGAGMQADSGITGLALLAFLASGHTHQDGLYKENVRRGLQYLLNQQANDGNMGGKASTYAFMYCHAMATFALSEAYGMTGDPLLRDPVSRAVGYTIAAQDPTGGGWRYNPGDPGDTSQLGWQLMALKSAELAGIAVPRRCRDLASRYIDSVSSGHYGGLSAYRAVEPVSRPMTAEALSCRTFLGMSPTHPAGREAGDYLLGELPGEGHPNYYYWYYATLGMYYLQGDHWERWNYALQKTLLSRQRKNGSVAGSWDPDTVWGGYGGRVYTPALATLSLEVYYR
ncbi:MAG: hypothetical protein HQ582_16980, partial [Planctomycetes bacterium]|nr:hypothetical protein [Planctomycetota bacterium]